MLRKHRTLPAQQAAALARRIRELRARLKLRQGPFAKLIGVSQQTVSDWEKGRRLRQVQVGLRLAGLLAQHP